MSNLIGVPHTAVDDIWELVAPFVVTCLTKSREHRLLLEDIHKMLIDRDLQLWCVEVEGKITIIVLTQILIYPRAIECDIFMTSGEYPEDWAEITEGLVTWAKAAGCSHMSANMRRGLVKRMGWDERQTYCVRAIT